MKRKRLQHIADILPQMFMGWRLANDLDQLVELGNGEYAFDLLANEVVEQVHNRMPVILPDSEAEAAWMSGDLEAEEAVSLCVPLEPGRLSAKPANPALNKVGGTKEGPEMLEA